jgi:hypothetical protein
MTDINKQGLRPQVPWEIELEKALSAATPEQVLEILHKIEGWTHGYCVSCGTFNVYGTKRQCSCDFKGFWNDFDDLKSKRE